MKTVIRHSLLLLFPFVTGCLDDLIDDAYYVAAQVVPYENA